MPRTKISSIAVLPQTPHAEVETKDRALRRAARSSSGRSRNDGAILYAAGGGVAQLDEIVAAVEESFAVEEARDEFGVVARCAHRDAERQRFLVGRRDGRQQADLERLLDRHRIGQLLAAAVDDVRGGPVLEVEVAHSAITSTTAL